MKSYLSPSILSADFGNLRNSIMAAEEAGAEYIHFDMMDGTFVPNISFGAPIVKAVRKDLKAFFDVHMMVQEPIRYIDDVAAAGADGITVHQEACLHLDRTIAKIKETGLKAGVALNPATPVETLSCILPMVDLVLIMTVNPGFGGQKFIPYTLDKVRDLRRIATERGLDLTIGVDGGVTLANIKEIETAGANFFIAGSAVFNPVDKIAENVKAFNALLKG
ncbi:ribulose-phosphate 3-epimerase [Oribacterium sp. WCC10]|uniref:ribulose-phosphate 3-epimerase n=1 Tax=Oribacterium sp. WCC10 TaxID=1855343 RepID=UPI0008F35B97|nr:ribulose-phosphate 3-epimerase [Oribacterium sp. WCC10]SFG56799.1 ribulose-phosphate 3-epimerase [Oribacterium sp. WCC10]